MHTEGSGARRGLKIALPTCLQRHPHTGLILNTTYDPYAPAAPSRGDYDAAPPISTLTTPYASALPPYLLLRLQLLRSHGALKICL
ncbi:hypothetical protein O181_011350 [Austropuccinia psidii MF-1]|uniref:Uncharacterized protein n=1 Tax=Austropuccinia psidii MF-1 TaxID=1389203 RepID=A0A9Q3BUZ3_9BASI|nr:hypothetical protein [Austropuccinia psidii MF-1]